MKNCVAKGLLLGAAIAFAGCAASTDTASTTPSTLASTSAKHRVAAKPTADIDCPMCFTIIEYMRSGPRHEQRTRTVMQCEHCCERLEFTTDAQGVLFVSTNAHPQPMPCDVCAPAPIR